MSEIPADLKYTNEHEWARIEGDVATVGITAHAVEQLGDITMVTLPEVGTRVTAGEPFGDIDSVKAVSELYAPVDGEIIEVNTTLEDRPELVNEAPYGDGWLVRIRVEGGTDALLSADAYAKLVEEA
ncbi:MAG: glycine cleavage system protein GcvH [Deltaproteobacteria bacterium]|nr:MAG: glycine cleavage system protein GcvH [Deltaproteobacteria bacterium]